MGKLWPTDLKICQRPQAIALRFEAKQLGSKAHNLTTWITPLPYLNFLISENNTNISLVAEKSQT